jgi:asparagine synthase (glutamine-hydrolysing)
MCGISGFISGSTSESVLHKMINAQAFRGPDSQAFYVNGKLKAGMARLAINDLSTGDQPFLGLKKTTVVFYNGEIYN